MAEKSEQSKIEEAALTLREEDLNDYIETSLKIAEETAGFEADRAIFRVKVR